jgi:hypothetical protein
LRKRLLVQGEERDGVRWTDVKGCSPLLYLVVFDETTALGRAVC